MMSYEAPNHLPARATPAGGKMSAAQRLRPPIAATSRATIPASKRSGRLAAEERATFAVANEAMPSSELVAKRSLSGRAARIVKEREMAALCERRASLWAESIRNGLDPDIARFVRDQATAWQLLATSYALSAKEA
jgi:hypothetical protein